MNFQREIIARYVETARCTLDVAVFVGGSLLQEHYETLVAASDRKVALRFLVADAASGWADKLAHPLALRIGDYEQRIYVCASRALMISAETQVRWQPFPLPWSFLISDGCCGYVKTIDLVSDGVLRELTPTEVRYYQALFEQAWSTSSSVAERSASNRQEGVVALGLRVFLCHASDDKEAARVLARRLRRDGANPWLDEEELLPGQDWENEISRAIHESDVFLLCLSESSVQKRGFVQREIRVARRVADEMPPGTIFIVPARLDDCVVPDELRHLQWVDLFRPEGYGALLRGLRVARARQ